ncbi:MAG: hypothetical protein AABX50_02520, partial [Nanoarchaeota archaeon]
MRNKRPPQVRSMSSLLRQRKGSHVGVVISFVLFITFIVFMYTILNYRIGFGENKKASLEQIKEAVKGEISENLTTVSIGITEVNPSCVQLDNFFGKTQASDKLLVKSDSGSALVTSKSGNDLFVETEGNTFFRVSESGEFSVVSTGIISSCQLLQESLGYVLGLSKTEDLIFESKMLNLLNNYTQNYSGLKKNLGISDEDEFGFIFTYSNSTQVRTPEKNLTIDIYAERVPVQYIKISGEREVGFID